MLAFLVLKGLKHIQPFWVDCCVCQINKQGVENWVPSCSSLKQNIWHPQFWKKNAHSSRVFRCFSVVPVALCLFVWSHLNSNVLSTMYLCFPRHILGLLDDLSAFSFTLPLTETNPLFCGKPKSNCWLWPNISCYTPITLPLYILTKCLVCHV